MNVKAQLLKFPAASCELTPYAHSKYYSGYHLLLLYHYLRGREVFIKVLLSVK